jgi:hypothetical protein
VKFVKVQFLATVVEVDTRNAAKGILVSFRMSVADDCTAQDVADILQSRLEDRLIDVGDDE